jgi:ATP-dependent DNA helicase RecQ
VKRIRGEIPEPILEESPDPLVESAQKLFDVNYLYPFQRLVIANVLDRVDQLVVFPTGGGKSLCFQLPAFFLPGITLVVMPLLALIADQIKSLTSKNINVEVIKGGQSIEERELVIRRLASGETKIVFATPEVLIHGNALEAMSTVTVSHLVVDEAHCISEWGESFRPHYLELHKIHETLDIPVVSAFTATASADVSTKIHELFFRDRPVSDVVANPDRPNIFYRTSPVLSKNAAISELVIRNKKPLIVFARSRKGAERIARTLARRFGEIDIRFYHAGLDPAERKLAEEWFKKSTDGVLVSTCAYGMGVDKKNIRAIVHADIPPSAEAYLQESGRAGRDGEQAEAILLYSRDDIEFERSIHDKIGRSRYGKILAYARATESCRRESLLSLLDYKLAEACSGCDVCEGSCSEARPGEEIIMGFVKKARRKFTLRETLAILKGDRSYLVSRERLYSRPGFGSLSDWHIDDIEEAIALLCAEGKIRIPKRGFWKYRLTIGKDG